MTINTVLIDSREPDWCRSLKIGNVQARSMMLNVGDAWIGTDDAMLIFERKTINDLCASIADNRLINQVEQMRKQSQWAYVVITGMPSIANGRLISNGRPTNWEWKSVQGMLLTVQELGVDVVYCENETHYGQTLEWIANRNRGIVKADPRREISLLSPAEIVLSSLPGIGQERARMILEKSGNLAWAFSWLTGSVYPGIYGEITVPGVGPATKSSVRSVLGLQDGYYLDIASIPDGNE